LKINFDNTILFVGGGLETVPGVKIAKRMGLRVVVSDINLHAPCRDYADFFLHADTYNITETINAVRTFCEANGAINGVMCLGSDIPLTVASIAAKFGLPGIPVVSAKIVSDKILMKNCFKENRLKIPWYTEIKSLKELKNIILEYGYPLVIKPVDSRGARGVLLLEDKIDLDWAFKTSLSYSPSSRIMVEEFLDGPQVSTESLVIDGVVSTIGFSDRNYERLKEYSPHIIEDGGDLPSFLSLDEQNKIKSAVELTANALGIRNGIIKGDMVLSNNEAYIIEVATRLSGGYFCSHEIPLNTGVDFVKNAIKIAMGLKLNKNSYKIKKNIPVSQRYFFPNPGKVKQIIIPDWIASETNVKLFELRVSVGDIIPKAVHHPARAGLVITTGVSRKKAIALAKKVVNEVTIITK
jgi:biotin carboxylase